MGVKLQLVLGLVLVFLSLCYSNSTTTSNTTATTTTLSPPHNERNPNLIEEPPKTDPEIKPATKSTRNDSASGETEKKSQHEKGSRAINIERYVSPEFQHNVFTLPDHSDAEKYLEEPSFPHKSSTSSGDFPDFDLTTPRTAFFDNKFTEAIQKLEQEYEANRGVERDEHEPDEDEIEHDHEYMHENDELENDPMDKMMESSEELPKNITYKHTKITKNNTADKNFAHNDFTVVHVRKIDISTNFNDTQVYTYDSDRDRNNSNATTPKTVDTTRKTVALTKPPVNKNNSYIFNNKIETETIKAINLPTEAPAKSSESSESIPRKTDSNESENKENLHNPSLQPAVTDRAENAITKPPYEKTESALEENPRVPSNNIKKEDNSSNKTQPKDAESATNDYTMSKDHEAMIKALFGSPERRGNFAPHEKTETSSTNTIGNAITKPPPENSTENVITKSPIVLTQRKLFETFPTATEAPREESSQTKLFETLPASSTENVITKLPSEPPTVTEIQATDETTTTEKQRLEDVTNTDAIETSHATTYTTIPITEASTETSSTKPETDHPTELTHTTELEVTIASTLPTNEETSSTDKREATTLAGELMTTEVVTEISLVETKTSITVETTEIPSTESTFTTSTAEIETTTEIPSTTAEVLTTFEPPITVTAFVTELQSGSKTSTNPQTITTEMLSKESIFPETTTYEGTTEVVRKRLNEDTTEVAKVTEVTTESTTSREEAQTTTRSETQPDWVPPSKRRNGDATEEPITRVTTDEGDDYFTQTSSATDKNVTGDGGGGEGKGKLAAIVISTVGALCLVLLSGLLYVMRKRQKRFNYMQNCRPVSLDDYSVENLSAYNSVRRKGLNRASKRSYGNPAFDDPNALSHPLNFPALAKFSTNVEDMKAEFDDIPQISATANELPDGCESKNRYANVIPLPETRVFLSTIEGCPNSDYINANYVTGPKDSKGYYIACQSPMQNTVDDFWRMIWEQNSKVVLMITHLFENGVEKCADYLPPSEVLDRHRLFGDFQVTLKKRDVKEKYIISSLQLKNMVSNSWREVTHFWYLGWPDKGVPAEANSLIAFLIEARSYMKSSTLDRNFPSTNDLSSLPSIESSPVVVHCSPGTGRTGVVVACDIAIREFEQTRLVDVPRVVYRIRRDRAGAVQTKEQYMFIYKVVSLYAAKLTGGALDSF